MSQTDADRGNRLTAWVWGPNQLEEVQFNTDPVAPGTSPTVTDANGTISVFFVDAAKGNNITNFRWTTTGFEEVTLFGHPAVGGTSPSAF